MKIHQEIYNSSAISEFVYDTETQILTVKFVRGSGSYDYPGIEQEVVERWLESESMGKYFHKYIKNHAG